MTRYPLYTYRNLTEFNKIVNDVVKKDGTIKLFSFNETGDVLKDCYDVVIDISSVTDLLCMPNNKGNAHGAIHELLNLEENSEYNKVIIESSLANKALDIFKYIFDEVCPYFDDATNEENSTDDENSGLI